MNDDMMTVLCYVKEHFASQEVHRLDTTRLDVPGLTKSRMTAALRRLGSTDEPYILGVKADQEVILIVREITERGWDALGGGR